MSPTSVLLMSLTSTYIVVSTNMFVFLLLFLGVHHLEEALEEGFRTSKRSTLESDKLNRLDFPSSKGEGETAIQHLLRV